MSEMVQKTIKSVESQLDEAMGIPPTSPAPAAAASFQHAPLPVALPPSSGAASVVGDGSPSAPSLRNSQTIFRMLHNWLLLPLAPFALSLLFFAVLALTDGRQLLLQRLRPLRMAPGERTVHHRMIRQVFVSERRRHRCQTPPPVARAASNSSPLPQVPPPELPSLEAMLNEPTPPAASSGAAAVAAAANANNFFQSLSNTSR